MKKIGLQSQNINYAKLNMRKVKTSLGKNNLITILLSTLLYGRDYYVVI